MLKNFLKMFFVNVGERLTQYDQGISFCKRKGSNILNNKKSSLCDTVDLSTSRDDTNLDNVNDRTKTIERLRLDDYSDD